MNIDYVVTSVYNVGILNQYNKRNI